MKGLVGIKVGMTQIYDEAGGMTPVTILQAGPCYVTQVKTAKMDGYNAIQLGYGEVKEKRLTRGQKGHLGLLSPSKKRARKNVENAQPLRHLNEFRLENSAEYNVGQELKADIFAVGEKIDVTGVTKGRGFAGVMKRHGFSGAQVTHGQSDRWRAPGSIGSGTTMSRVIKGLRMAGHMGSVRHTTQNLQIVRIDAERNLIAVRGAVPGAKGGLVLIRSAVKVNAKRKSKK